MIKAFTRPPKQERLQHQPPSPPPWPVVPPEIHSPLHLARQSFRLSHHRLTGAAGVIVLVEGCAVVDAVEHLVLKLLVIVGKQKGGHFGILLQYGLS